MDSQGEERGVYLELYRHLHRQTPDVTFRFDSGEQIFAHSLVLREFCEGIPFVEEEGGKKVVTVPTDVDSESVKYFIKAVYLGTLEVSSFALLSQVRALGVLWNSEDVTRQCDKHVVNQQSVFTEDNYHVGLEKWPEGSHVHQTALDYTIKNLKSLVNSNMTLSWSVASWKSVLQRWKVCPILEIPLSKEELYESVRSWREMEENAVGEKDDAFVEMIMLMDASFLYETVVPNALLTDRLIVQLASHYYNQEKLQKQNGTCSCTHELWTSSSSRCSSQQTSGQGTSTFSGSGSNEAVAVARNKRKRNPTAKVIDNPFFSASGSKRTALGGSEPDLRGVQFGRGRKRKEVSNYKELVNILKTVKSGDHILMKEGKFFGQLSLTLPNNVTISGMGEGTVVTARNNDYIWDITAANGKNCVIENLHFWKSPHKSNNHREPGSESRGLWTSGSDLTVRTCTFTHCGLGIGACTKSKFETLICDSSFMGIFLTAEASEITITDVVFNKVATGISCWAQRVTMTDLTMSNVDAGVVILPDVDLGDGVNESGNDNKVSNLTYSFDPEEITAHQVAAEIYGCKNNTLEGIKCVGYSPIPNNVVGIDRLGIRIQNHDTDERFLATGNAVLDFGGAPMTIDGNANILNDIQENCPLLVINGGKHDLKNVKVNPNSILFKCVFKTEMEVDHSEIEID